MAEHVWRAYRVDAVQLGPGGERVLVTSHDEAGDLLVWSAEPDRAPRLGQVVNVTMHARTDPPSDEQSGSREVDR